MVEGCESFGLFFLVGFVIILMMVEKLKMAKGLMVVGCGGGAGNVHGVGVWRQKQGEWRF